MATGQAFIEGDAADMDFFAIRRDPASRTGYVVIHHPDRRQRNARRRSVCYSSSAYGRSCDSGSNAGFGQCSAVIPRHPPRRFCLPLAALPQQHREIVERISAAQLRGVNQAHEQVADVSPILRPVEQGVLSATETFP